MYPEFRKKNGKDLNLKGHPARVRAHIRPIIKACKATLDIIECGNESELTDSPDIPWNIGLIKKTKDVKYDEVLFMTLESMRETHQEILDNLESWQSKDPGDERIRQVCKYIPELATMAWKLERIKRKQDTGSNYVTYEADPLAVRLMAMAWDQRSLRDDRDTAETVILDHVRFRKTLRKSQKDQLASAISGFQRMINTNGDSVYCKEIYIVENSDIADLRRFTIEFLNGQFSAIATNKETSAHDNPIIHIASESTLIKSEIPEMVRTSAIHNQLSLLISHPITDGIDLIVKSINPPDNQDEITTIFYDGQKAKNLVPVTIRMDRK